MLNGTADAAQQAAQQQQAMAEAGAQYAQNLGGQPANPGNLGAPNGSTPVNNLPNGFSIQSSGSVNGTNPGAPAQQVQQQQFNPVAGGVQPAQFQQTPTNQPAGQVQQPQNPQQPQQPTQPQQPGQITQLTQGDPTQQQPTAAQRIAQDPALHAERERMMQERQAQLEMQQFDVELRNWGQQKYNHYTSQGVQPAVAQSMVNDLMNSARMMAQTQVDSDRSVQNQKAMLTVASGLSNQYGIPVDRLLRYDSPQAMEYAAQDWQQGQAQVQALEQRVQQVEQGQAQVNAPVQNFGMPGQGVASMGSLVEGVANGTISSQDPTMLSFLLSTGVFTP